MSSLSLEDDATELSLLRLLLVNCLDRLTFGGGGEVEVEAEAEAEADDDEAVVADFRV